MTSSTAPNINIDYNDFFKLSKLVEKNIGHIEFYGYNNVQIRWIYDLTDEYNKLTKLNEKDFSIEAFQKLENIGFPNNDYSLKKLLKNKSLAIDNNGNQFFNLKTLLKWKKIMNRPKDQDNIKLLKKNIN